MHGIVDEKIDIFSFGVLLLELITGRQALDDSKNSLVLWVRFSLVYCSNFKYYHIYFLSLAGKFELSFLFMVKY